MIEIDGYYDYAELTEKLEELAESPAVALDSIGESPGGKQLWCATAAGPDRHGAPDDRPAVLVTANMHAREYAGSWSSLALLDRFADAYGNDPELTELLDRRTFYVLPRLCPDGADVVFETGTGKCRSRFVDVDPDDVREPNTVVPEDLTGDGRILSMRWPADGGDTVVPADDPRLSLSREPEATEGTFYRQTTEGVVVNYDGGAVSEVAARCDFNRNFPAEHWDTYDWIGHGHYPLSEPETRALADFVLEHPNIAIIADLHNGNPALFPPMALRAGDPSSVDDRELLERIAERGAEVTGFPFIDGYYEAKGDDPYVLSGSFKDWAYERTGALALVVEQGMICNSLGFDTEDLGMDEFERERQTSEAILAYHDEHPDRGVFHEWKTVEHPQLGEVEVGGWDYAHYSVPTLEEMPSIADSVVEWLLELGEWTPEVTVDAAVEPLENGYYRVTATVRNPGRLPTNLTERGRESVLDEAPVARLDGTEPIAGPKRRLLDHLPARGGTERLEWVVTETDGVSILVESPRVTTVETPLDGTARQ
ncbi:M14 family metallopeptidase [Haloarchaeobius sp. TZWSO28]|uniref:M14 family metallopeptidase n=1 Tax=Haloarchaeobius sp. TZWSO28 TaxID=3446119 RepID=UPI003EBBD238